MKRTVFVTIKAELDVDGQPESEITEDDIQNFFSETMYYFPPVSIQDDTIPDGGCRTIIADTNIIDLYYDQILAWVLDCTISGGRTIDKKMIEKLAIAEIKGIVPKIEDK